MDAPSPCPLCGQTSSVNKVSAVYIAGLQARKANAGTELGQVRGIPPEDLPELSRRFTPPATRKEAPIRLIHPDLIVLAFSVIVPFFLSGIYARQRGNFYPMLIGLAVAYLLYVWQRKRILARFARQEQAEQDKKARVQRAIQRWMRLYYCADDDVVFAPGGAPPLPADQINGYLYQDWP